MSGARQRSQKVRRPSHKRLSAGSSPAAGIGVLREGSRQGSVSQQEEDAGSNPVMCGFEPHRSYCRDSGNMEERWLLVRHTCLLSRDLRVRGFDSLLFRCGGVTERFKVAVLKTVAPLETWVRIPPPPLHSFEHVSLP